MPNVMEACIAELEGRKTAVREKADAQIEKLDAAIATLRGLDGLLLPGPTGEAAPAARKEAPAKGTRARPAPRYFKCKKCKKEVAWPKLGRLPKLCAECKAEKNG